jgi:fructokinase
MNSTIGIDLGGTKISGILLDQHGRVRKKITKPTESSKGKETILKNILEIIDFLKTPNVTNIGLGVPGRFYVSGEIYAMQNIPHLVGCNLKREIEEKNQIRVILENDTNCFALAESTLGAGKHSHTVVGVIIGTGLGVGMTINGKIVRGQRVMNSKFMNIHGIETDMEKLIAGPAFLRRYSHLSGKNPKSVQEISRYDTSYKETYGEFVINTARLFSHLIITLHPKTIVVGGGLSNINFYNDVKKEIKKHHLPDYSTKLCEIKKNKLGSDSGVLGAAILARHPEHELEITISAKSL